MRNTDSAERVRRFLRAERKRRNWTQRDLAQRAGIAKNTVASLERGMALREGNEGAVEEALGLTLGTLEDIRRGRYTPPETDRPAEEDTPPGMPDAADYPSEYEYILAVVSHLVRDRKMPPDEVVIAVRMAAAALRDRSNADGKEVG